MFLTLALGGVVNFTPWLLYRCEKSPRYPLDRRLGSLRTNLDDEWRKVLLVPELELDPLAVQPIASCYSDCIIWVPN